MAHSADLTYAFIQAIQELPKTRFFCEIGVYLLKLEAKEKKTWS